MLHLDRISNIHIIGAGGIGLSAVAKLLKHEGKRVTGSDLAESETTAELAALGIPVKYRHLAKNVPADCELVLYSGAVPPANPERKEAKKREIPEMSYAEFLGEFSRGKFTIAVSGTNGKSTTTALLGLMLERAGFDPTVIVGSKVKSFPDRNLRIGRSKYFVVEACEHEANMLKLYPQVIVLTNIEEDHLDFYGDLAHIREAFQKYIDNLPPDGQLILNADDHVSFYELHPAVPLVTYGIGNRADYMARHARVTPGRQTFEVVAMSKLHEVLGEFALHVPGSFNVMNALAAATAALELGVPVQAIRETIAAFTGIWRRFERIGERDGALVISDYGHHPTAVHGTLQAARDFYPDRRIVLVFQPHQHNRTRQLFNEFVASFDGADALILSEIYGVAGRTAAEDRDVSSEDLVEAVIERDERRGKTREVAYAESIEETLAALEQTAQPDDLVLVMGAGDIFTLAERFCSHKAAKPAKVPAV